MWHSRLFVPYSKISRCGLSYSLSSSSNTFSFLEIKEKSAQNIDFKRQYHPFSTTKLLRHDNHKICKRSLSMESIVSTHLGIYKFITECSGTNYVKQFIVSVHDTTGLPWWATVILSTFIFRSVITFPLTVFQASVIAKIENITLLEMPEVAKELQKETALKAREFSWPAKKANMYYKINLRNKLNALIIRDNCHPFKSYVTLWFQIPTWVFFSAALRNLAYMLPLRNAEAELLYLQLSVGGFLWVPNLTLPDGLLIMPILLGLSNLAIIEIQTMMRLRETTRLQRYATNFFRGVSLLFIPISATVPSVLCLYWTTSSIVGLAQNLILMSNRVRKACGIPDTPTTHDHPYQQLMYEIKEKVKTLLFIKRKT